MFLKKVTENQSNKLQDYYFPDEMRLSAQTAVVSKCYFLVGFCFVVIFVFW